MRKGLIAVLLVLTSTTGYAGQQADTSTEPDVDGPAEERASKFYGYLFVGTFDGTENAGQLKTARYKGGSRIPWGLGSGYHVSEHFSVDAGFEYWGDRYERAGAAIIPGTANNFLQIDNIGVSFTAKYQYTYRKLNVYAGLGAGYFFTDLYITNPSNGLLTTDGAPDDNLLGYHFAVGAGYRVLARSYLGIELRNRIAKVDFGEYTNGEVDVGGTSILLVWYGM